MRIVLKPTAHYTGLDAAAVQRLPVAELQDAMTLRGLCFAGDGTLRVYDTDPAREPGSSVELRAIAKADREHWKRRRAG